MSVDSLHHQQQRIDKFGPNLCSILISLLEEIVDHCQSQNFSLTKVSAFSDQDD